MSETWKDVQGYSNYEVSDKGRVRSKRGVLKTRLNRGGYFILTLCKQNHKYTKKPHRLVAEAFLPHVQENREVNHKDGDKQNNEVDNLEWVSRSENIKHAYSKGLMDKKGIKNCRAALTEEDVLRIRENLECKPISDLAKEYGVGNAAISKIILCRNWKHI